MIIYGFFISGNLVDIISYRVKRRRKIEKKKVEEELQRRKDCLSLVNAGKSTDDCKRLIMK